MQAENQKIYYIDQDREKRNSAGAKAPDDIVEICRQHGYSRLVEPVFPAKKGRIYKKLWLLTVCSSWWSRLSRKLPADSAVIYQHPDSGKRIAAFMIRRLQRKKNCSFIAVIHDLESLRGGIAGVIEKHTRTHLYGDNDLLKCFDAVICHNEHMRQYLIGQGFREEKLINLELFDYLSDSRRVQPPKGDVPSIAIAGNLAIGKCRYLYDICDAGHNPGLRVNLYGNHFNEENASENLVWHGSFRPEELPEHLTGDFGLVWDGESAETCAGNTGNYLRYNNPHKTSLYLSSGMPVIVWSQAAVADFVLKNGVGLTVDSLYELETKIRQVPEAAYQEMCENSRRLAGALHAGAYFSAALERALAQANRNHGARTD